MFGKNDSRGFALPLVITVMVVLCVLFAAIFPVIIAGKDNATAWAYRDKALYVAESGVNYALLQLNAANDLGPFAEQIGTAGERFSAAVGLHDDGSLKIVSDGYCGKGHILKKKRVNVKAARSGPPLFYAEMVNIQNGAYPLEVNFQVPEAPGNRQEPGQVIDPGDHSYDQFSAAPHGAVTINGPARIFVAGDFKLDQVDLQVNGEVIFYIKGAMRVSNHSTITLNGSTAWYIEKGIYFDRSGIAQTAYHNSYAVFYAGDSLSFADQCTINANSQAKSVLFYLKTDRYSGDVSILDNSLVCAGIYAPTRNFYMTGDSFLRGAVICNASEEVTDYMELDGSLLSINSGPWAVYAWWEE